MIAYAMRSSFLRDAFDPDESVNIKDGRIPMHDAYNSNREAK